MSSQPAIAQLPPEIIFEIVSYLDKPSLKSLRVACPRPSSVLFAAASSGLFRSLALRLCTPLWTTRYIKAKLAYLDRCERDALPLLFSARPAVVREIVVDTRYPFDVAVSQSPTLDGVLRLNVKAMAADAMEGFVQLVRKVVALATGDGGVADVRWRSTSLIPPPVYAALAEILCPGGQSRYRLNISFRLESYHQAHILPEYIARLSGATSLALGFDFPTNERLNAVIAAIERSPRLTSLTVQMPCPPQPGFDATVDLWDAAFRIPALDTLVLSDFARLEYPLPTPPVEQVAKLRHVKLIASLPQPHRHSLTQQLVHDMRGAGTQLQTLQSNFFGREVAEFLSASAPNRLTVLDVECVGDEIATQKLGFEFWNGAVARNAHSLRFIRGYYRIFDATCEDWAWLEHPGNPAKRALDNCTALEELTVSCVDFTDNIHVAGMLVHLLRQCRRLGIINLAFPMRTPRYVLDMTVASVESWVSEDPAHVGRSLQVRYHARDDWGPGHLCTLRGQQGPLEAPMLFDGKIQAWELQAVGRDGKWASDSQHLPAQPRLMFRAQDDSYIFDDTHI